MEEVRYTANGVDVRSVKIRNRVQVLAWLTYIPFCPYDAV